MIKKILALNILVASAVLRTSLRFPISRFPLAFVVEADRFDDSLIVPADLLLLRLSDARTPASSLAFVRLSDLVKELLSLILDPSMLLLLSDKFSLLARVKFVSFS